MKSQIATILCSSLLFAAFASPVLAKPAFDHAHLSSHGDSYQKPGAPVRLASKTQYRVAVGQEAAIEIVLKLAPGETQIRLQNDAGLIVNGPSSWQVNEPESHQTLTVTPLAAQKAYIHVYVEHSSPDGHVSTRALAVAIDSRSAQQALKAVKPAKPFIEMQAAETIY